MNSVYYKLKKYQYKNTIMPKKIYEQKISMYKKILKQHGGMFCPVCQEIRTDTRQFIIVPCGHSICEVCYNEIVRTAPIRDSELAFRTHVRCPSCRGQIQNLKSVTSPYISQNIDWLDSTIYNHFLDSGINIQNNDELEEREPSNNSDVEVGAVAEDAYELALDDETFFPPNYYLDHPDDFTQSPFREDYRRRIQEVFHELLRNRIVIQTYQQSVFNRLPREEQCIEMRKLATIYNAVIRATEQFIADIRTMPVHDIERDIDPLRKRIEKMEGRIIAIYNRYGELCRWDAENFFSN